MSGVVRRTYRCELLTPMIMSGADQSKAELRAPSIKGALRWWWRALNPTDDYEDLRRREFEIFGGIFGEGDDKQTKSKVNVDVAWVERPRVVGPNSFSDRRNTPLNFLAYGTEAVQNDRQPEKNKPERKAFDSGGIFELRLKIDAARAEEVERAVAIMLNYGGFGMKARNGYGQLHCDQTADMPLNLLKQTGLTHAPSFGDWTRIEFPIYFGSARRAHEAVGKAYRAAKNPLKGQEPKQFLMGAGNKNLFAAHAPNQFRHKEFKVDPTASGDKNVLPRKAKTIQLYIRRQQDGRYRAGMLALPYQLGVTYQRAQVKSPGGLVVLREPDLSHEAVIQYFMNAVKANEGIA